MNRTGQLQYLIDFLLAEMPEYREQAETFPPDDASQRRLLRSLMNIRPPMPLDPKFLEVQDALLSAEVEEKGVVGPPDGSDRGGGAPDTEPPPGKVCGEDVRPDDDLKAEKKNGPGYHSCRI